MTRLNPVRPELVEGSIGVAQLNRNLIGDLSFRAERGIQNPTEQGRIVSESRPNLKILDSSVSLRNDSLVQLRNFRDTSITTTVGMIG